jgi:hypothetical protein
MDSSGKIDKQTEKFSIGHAFFSDQQISKDERQPLMSSFVGPVNAWLTCGIVYIPS